MHSSLLFLRTLSLWSSILYNLSLDFRSDFNVGLLDNRHLLIKLNCEEDYLRVYSRTVWYIGAVTMRIFKWTPNLSTEKETSLVPVWITLPRLPVHLFAQPALFRIATLIGRPLRLDSATRSLKRPGVARLQIELDVLKDRPNPIWIGMGSLGGFWQKIEYENVPPYCTHCWHIGHSENLCHIHNPELKSLGRPEKQVVSKPSSRQVYVPKASSEKKALEDPAVSEPVEVPTGSVQEVNATAAVDASPKVTEVTEHKVAHASHEVTEVTGQTVVNLVSAITPVQGVPLYTNMSNPVEVADDDTDHSTEAEEIFVEEPGFARQDPSSLAEYPFLLPLTIRDDFCLKQKVSAVSLQSAPSRAEIFQSLRSFSFHLNAPIPVPFGSAEISAADTARVDPELQHNDFTSPVLPSLETSASLEPLSIVPVVPPTAPNLPPAQLQLLPPPAEVKRPRGRPPKSSQVSSSSAVQTVPPPHRSKTKPLPLDFLLNSPFWGNRP